MADSTVVALPRRQGDLFKQTPLGLTVSERVTFEEWHEFGERLGAIHNAMPWWVGDWQIAGEKFGEEAAQALGDHYAPETMQVYKSVCKSIPLERRRPALSFRHHQQLTGLRPNEQDQLLDLAEKNEWSSRELKAEVDERHPERKKPKANTQPSLPVDPQKPPEPAQSLGNSEPLRGQSDAPKNVENRGLGNRENRAEPAPVESLSRLKVVQPLSAEDAVNLLTDLPPGALPESLAHGIRLLLEERMKLVRFVTAARAAAVDFACPPLDAALAELNR
jgi:hypothetical protein